MIDAMDFLAHLTDSQRRAVLTVDRSVVVSAAAGAGKTSVLAERCASLVCDVDPAHRCGVDELLVVTFTEAAAEEMRSRIAAAIQKRLDRQPRNEPLRQQLYQLDNAAISTIHAFCKSLIQRWFPQAGVDPQAAVLAGDEAELLKREVVEALFLERYAGQDAVADAFRALVDEYGGGQDGPIAEIVLRLHRFINSLPDPEGWLADAVDRVNPDAPGNLAGEVDTLQYDRLKREIALQIEYGWEAVDTIRRCWAEISRVWEQMHLAYRYGANRIWIVNVGDIKPMEFPIEVFLDYAWNPEQWPAERLPEYTRLWAERQFGPEHAQDIADILTQYTRFNSRRKPELLAPDTYSLVNYREAETVVAEYNELAAEAQRISDSLPAEYKDAFYQLVLHPVEACANLNELYVTVGKNRLYAQQGRAAANTLAQKARELFKRDAEITHYYNNVMANGKWAHMMDQTHIGYTYWQQPDSNSMPEVKAIAIPGAAEMGVAIEGSAHWWPHEKSEAVLPEFDPYHQQTYYIEIFNRGRTPFEYSVQAGELWVEIAAVWAAI